MNPLPPVRLNLRQQAKHRDAVRCAYIYLAIDDGGRLKVAGNSKLVAPARRLITIVEFRPEIPGQISVQDRRAAVLDGPQDAVPRAVR